MGPANENNFKSQAGSPAGGLPFRYNGESELNSGGTRMTDWQTTELQAALVNSLVDQSQGRASVNFGPRLLDNQGTPTWLTLRYHLLTCRRFCFSVAFISDAMVSNLKPLLRQLAAKGVTGQLLTATYLNFNTPKVFAELLKLPNLEVRVAAGAGFHQKGYWFDHGAYATFLVGSANLTAGAMLGRNQEWMLQLDSRAAGAFTGQFQQLFARQWAQAQPLTAAWLAAYQANYQAPPSQPLMAAPTPVIRPNRMQAAALAAIEQLRGTGARRGLVISATGTGKTYLAAFAVQAARPQRLLFVAHREQILQKARRSFQKVLGGAERDYGLLTGNRHDWGAKYLFATVQTLQKNLAAFEPAEFDYLIIDEVHHAGAATYQALLDYFHPTFCLGLTATPERTDEVSVFDLFDHQVAYEIRLPEALAAEMLVPFHYVGIADYQFTLAAYNQRVTKYQAQFATGSAHRADAKAVALLTSDERVAYLLAQTAYYGYSGDQLHGLIFCASVLEATELAAALCRHGHPAAALSGTDGIARREQLVAQLTAGQLEYLVTVDIFNEGIDIPCINQVVFLRNTASPIVYQQQLGRGLRKSPGKDYLVVIDFIGNFKHNYLLPLALTGAATASADAARATVQGQTLVGQSTIEFEPVAQERVLATLSQAHLTALSRLRPLYMDLKARLGRRPALSDFQRYGVADPLVVTSTGPVRNYAQFLAKMGEPVTLTDYQHRVLNFCSAELLNGKRRHELLLLAQLLNQPVVTAQAFQAQLQAHGCVSDPLTLRSVHKVLDLSYFAKRARPTQADYGSQPVVEFVGNHYQWGPQMRAALQTTPQFRALVADTVKTGLALAQAYRPDQLFTRGQKYTRKDAVRLINNPKNLNAQIVSGYYFTNAESQLHEGIFFVSYQKRQGIKKALAYQNEFIGHGALRFFLNGKDIKPTAKNVQRLLSGQDRLHLFVQRSNALDQQSYYYLGTCHYQADSLTKVVDGDLTRLAVNLALDTPLDDQLLRLLTGEEDA